MAIISSTVIRKRASRRIIRDLPLDPDDLDMDDPILVMVYVREELKQAHHVERGRRPAERMPRFGIPAMPLTTRLRSDSGMQSFHLSIGKALRGSAAGYDGYATKGARVELEATAKEQDGPSARDLDSYMLDHGAGDDTAPISITNLDPDEEVRQRQWPTIEQEEYRRRPNPEGGPPRIAIRYEAAPDFLTDVALIEDCPEGLRAIILGEQARIASGRSLPKQHQRDGVPWVSADAPAAMQWIEALPGWREQSGKASKDRPVRISKGRGIVAVHRGELELPANFDAAATKHVMTGLDAYLQAQRAPDPSDPSRAGPTDFVPSMFAVHQPDALNDARNLHLHFLHGTRAASLDDHGALRFADAKITGIAAKGWMKRLRCEAARLVNIELDRLRADYRLSPDTYAAMGIDASAQQKLDGERTVLERAGVRTDAGLANSTDGWQRKITQAKHRYIDAELALGARSGAMESRISLIDDTARRRKLEAEREAALAAEKRALRLRLEAEEAAIWIEMARSAPMQTARFASGYADKAKRKDGRDSYDSTCWRERGQAANDYLATLDRELVEERAAIADRDHEAERAMETAVRGWSAIEIELSRPADLAPMASVQATPAASERATPAAAITRIAGEPLMVSHTAKGYAILPIDDPDGLITGVDLSSQQARLKGIYAAQQKELRQLVAAARKHGIASLSDESLMVQSEWMRRTAVKWRDTGALRRLIARDQAAGLPDIDAIDDGIRAISLAPALTPEEPRLPIAPIGDIVFASGAPRLAPVPARLSKADDRVEAVEAVPSVVPVDVAPAAPANVPATVPAPVSAKIAPATETAGRAPVRSLPADDIRFDQHVEWTQSRERERIMAEMMDALAARFGDRRNLPPHGARLLDRVFTGFDPDKIDRRRPPTGRTLDQRDADEILAARRYPAFAAMERAARGGDPALRAVVTNELSDQGRADPLGRVALHGQRLAFTPDTSAADRRAPHDWIERDLLNVPIDTIRLSRHRELVGAFDRRLLDAMHHNHVGLLYPDVQLRLEVQWRLQREEDEQLLRQISSGLASVNAHLRHDRATGTTLSRVDAGPELAAHPSIRRGRDNPEWYVACRKAQLGIEVPQPMRHPNLTIAAWLRARDEQASPALLALMEESIRQAKAKPAMVGLRGDDATALAALFVAPVAIQSLGRPRKRKRGTPPLQPGRGGYER